MTSGIYIISANIENQKKKLIPSLYGMGDSYKHIFIISLVIFVKIQKIWMTIHILLVWPECPINTLSVDSDMLSNKQQEYLLIENCSYNYQMITQCMK